MLDTPLQVFLAKPTRLISLKNHLVDLGRVVVIYKRSFASESRTAAPHNVTRRFGTMRACPNSI